jgi:hypothetical protein
LARFSHHSKVPRYQKPSQGKRGKSVYCTPGPSCEECKREDAEFGQKEHKHRKRALRAVRVEIATWTDPWRSTFSEVSETIGRTLGAKRSARGALVMGVSAELKKRKKSPLGNCFASKSYGR